MTLQSKLRNDLMEAVRKEDRVRRSVLRLVLSAMNNAEIAQQRTLDDAGVIDVIVKEVKQRRESIDAFSKGNRPDLVAQEQAEMAVLQEYLPKALTRDEIVSLVRQAIAETGVKGPGDKGKVMARVMPQTRGKADGKEVSDIATELLASL